MCNLCNCVLFVLFVLALGPVSPQDVGVTLSHEHLLLDFTSALKSRTEYGDDDLSDLDFILWNMEKIRRYP